jgi:hypothetical protein
MDTKAQQRTAQHETLHALLAMQCSTVHHVRVWPRGETEVSFPFTPASLGLYYAKRPEETHRRMIQVLAAIMAPHVLTGAPLAEEDDVSDWQAAYNKLPNASLHWKSVLSHVHVYVREWYRAPGRADLVEKVAEALTKCAVVNGDKAWRALVQGCQPPRQAPRSTGSIDLNRLRPEILECLMDLYDWRTVGHGRAGFVLRSW